MHCSEHNRLTFHNFVVRPSYTSTLVTAPEEDADERGKAAGRGRAGTSSARRTTAEQDGSTGESPPIVVAKLNDHIFHEGIDGNEANIISRTRKRCTTSQSKVEAMAAAFSRVYWAMTPCAL